MHEPESTAPVERPGRAHARDFCVVAIRAFGFYPIITSLTQLASVLPYYSMWQGPGLDYSAWPFIVGQGGALLCGVFCVLFAPWIACRFYGRPAPEELDGQAFTIDGAGVLRAGIAIAALWVALEAIPIVAELIQARAYEEVGGDIDMTSIVSRLGTTLGFAAALWFGAESIASTLERRWPSLHREEHS